MTHTGADADNLAARAAGALRAFRDGDPHRMSALVGEATPLLWAVARQQGLDRETAEDVVQTTWMKLVEHAQGIADPQSVLKWLIITTKREAWHLASVARREEPGAADDVRETETDAVHPPPESRMLADEDQRLVWTHFAVLPERCRVLLRAIAFADKPDYAGVAEALEMPIGSIGPTRGRCLAKLRAALTSDPRWEPA